MYKLIIEDDEGKTTVVPLIRDEITIGRKEGNTIRLTERNVSRRHARLLKSNGSIYIEDLQSYNGIKVNGEKIPGRAPVNEGDRIQIGDYQLALKIDKTASADRGDEKTTPFLKDGSEAATRQNAVLGSESAPTRASAIISAVAPDGERPARLVVVSSNFARQEFPLEKAAVVIGRTDENDVVINHRSISRHHAKIVREGGHYHVVDLQSANGVRVNGEEYGKVELRKGDHIDLGHVRLRFVAPGEDFVFDRDAKIVDVGEKKGKGGLMAMAAVAVLLIAGGGFAVWKVMGGPKDGGGGKTGGDSKELAHWNFEADKAAKAMDWDGCVTATEKGLGIDSSAETLRDKKAKCESEKKNKSTYEEYSKAAKDGDSERAVAAHENLPAESVYFEKAKETWNFIVKNYVTTHLGDAEKARGAGKCDEARKHVEAILIVDENNAEAQEIAKKCGGPAPVPPIQKGSRSSGSKRQEKVAPTPTKPAAQVEAPPKPVEVEKPKPAEAPKGADGPSADSLVSEAQDAYVHGDYTKAIELARKAIAAGAGTKGWRIVGASACFRHDKDEAIKAYNRLSPMDRQFVKYVCQRNNVDLGK